MSCTTCRTQRIGSRRVPAKLRSRFRSCLWEGFMPLHTAIHRSLEVAWVGFLVVWLAVACFEIRAIRRQGWWSRALTLAVGVVPYYLLFTDKLRYGALAWRFVPGEPWVLVAGVALTYAGI